MLLRLGGKRHGVGRCGAALGGIHKYSVLFFNSLVKHPGQEAETTDNPKLGFSMNDD